MSRLWSEQEISRLKQHYPDRPTKEVASLLNRGLSGVYVMAAKLGLKKSQEFLDSDESGRLKKGQTRPGTERTQFPKGHVPANKGLRRPGWHTGRMKETQFQKGVRLGNAAQNWKPIGTILADREGYLRIKIRDAVHGKEATGFGNTKVWPLLNRYTWEQHNGPIPPEHLVIFKDGNRKNCSIENLELISRAELARRKSMWTNLPRELAEVIQLNGALKRKIRRLNGTKQNEGSSKPSVRNSRSAEGRGKPNGAGPGASHQSSSSDAHR